MFCDDVKCLQGSRSSSVLKRIQCNIGFCHIVHHKRCHQSCTFKCVRPRALTSFKSHDRSVNKNKRWWRRVFMTAKAWQCILKRARWIFFIEHSGRALLQAGFKHPYVLAEQPLPKNVKLYEMREMSLLYFKKRHLAIDLWRGSENFVQICMMPQDLPKLFAN